MRGVSKLWLTKFKMEDIVIPKFKSLKPHPTTEVKGQLMYA